MLLPDLQQCHDKSAELCNSSSQFVKPHNRFRHQSCAGSAPNIPGVGPRRWASTASIKCCDWDRGLSYRHPRCTHAEKHVSNNEAGKGRLSDCSHCSNQASTSVLEEETCIMHGQSMVATTIFGSSSPSDQWEAWNLYHVGSPSCG